MDPLFRTSEFWAAIVGGLFTLAGAVISLSLQSYLQSRERSRIARLFFTKQVRHFLLLISHTENVFNNQGVIWYDYIDNFRESYVIINRNLEHLAFIDSEEQRTALRNFFANVYATAQKARFNQDKFAEFQRVIENNETDEKLREKAKSGLIEARQLMKDGVLELRRLALSAPHAVKKT